MSKYEIDFSSLHNNLEKKAYKLSEVKDRIEKVAFDVVRFKDGDISADLWKVQSGENGEQYIVALYNEDLEKKADWEVELLKTADALQIYYKKDPIVRISCKKLGINKGEINQVKEYLPNKLSENKNLVRSLLNELNQPAKKEVLNKYPELNG